MFFKFLPQSCGFRIRWVAVQPLSSVLSRTLFAGCKLAGFLHRRIRFFPPQAAHVFRVGGGGGWLRVRFRVLCVPLVSLELFLRTFSASLELFVFLLVSLEDVALFLHPSRI